MSIATLFFSIFDPEDDVYWTERDSEARIHGRGWLSSFLVLPWFVRLAVLGSLGTSPGLSFPTKWQLIPRIGFVQEQMNWCKEPRPGPPHRPDSLTVHPGGPAKGGVAQPSPALCPRQARPPFTREARAAAAHRLSVETSPEPSAVSS